MNYGTETNPTGVKKLVQISEEVQKPVHVPVVLGNECFILTQQDIRKIEDVRFVSYHKLGPNGEIIPVDMIVGQECALRDAVINAARFHNDNQSRMVALQLLEMLGFHHVAELKQQTPTVASISQQMDWAHSANSTSPAYPFTYSKSTSMNDMPKLSNRANCCSCCCAPPPKCVTNKGCNTIENGDNTDHIECPLSARQMLKNRKIIEDTMGI